MFWTDERIKQVREAMRLDALRPPEVRFQEMVDRGAIDKDGKVVLRRPDWPGQMYPGQPRPDWMPKLDDPDESA